MTSYKPGNNMLEQNNIQSFALDYENNRFGSSLAIFADCFEWMIRIDPNSIHAIVTDPPYAVKDFDPAQLKKRKNGNGGIWRIPPSFDGNKRAPMPRFTALNKRERNRLQQFFSYWAKLALKILRPGGHLFLASNSFLAQLVFESVIHSGFEFRGQIIRSVRTLRGGDRPKNAEDEFPDVCTMPRGCYEPWGLFRKPIPKGMKVSDCLREFETGGLRRKSNGMPFEDIIESERTSKKERMIANHPSLKPQAFMRQIVFAALPLGKGVILDPFMGSGSTIAAAEAVGYQSIGIERYREFYALSLEAIPKLSKLITGHEQLALALT
ncbi:MAG: site-specific DNA-methyltransferase [Anaerolineales bacterium]|nr:site-specific DNA-methyltransferase [Anaerolineales bacterium]